MDILLVNPGTELNSKKKYNREPPSGLLCIANYLRLNGLDVKVVDAEDKKLLHMYLDLEPKIVGITCLTNTFNKAVEIASEIKRKLNNTKIVMGGPHATFMWKEILEKYDVIDFVIIGEGEYSLLELYNSVDNFRKIQGLAFRMGDEIVSNGFSAIFDVNSFKYPERYYIIPNKYEVASVIVNRGCPFNCSFCARQKLFREVRIRNPENIVDEMLDIEKLEYSFIGLYDNININQEVALKICKNIKNKGLKIGWGAELRLDKLSEHLAYELSSSGCQVIAVGIESADENVLKLNGKYQSLDMVRKGIKNAKNAGLAIQCYFVIGLPGETNESFEKTIKFIEELPLIPGVDRIDFFMATPYPGSRLFENGGSEFNIKIIDKNWDHYDTEHVIFETEHLSLEDLQELFNFAKKYQKAFNGE